jgi:hypothetical protein
MNYIGQDGSFLERRYVIGPRRVITANLGNHHWLQPACFWRRAAYQACGGIDRSLQFCMDLDLFLRLTELGPARRLPGPPTAEFRSHEDAKSSTLLAVFRTERVELLRRYSSKALRRASVVLRLWWQWQTCVAKARRLLHSSFGIEL